MLVSIAVIIAPRARTFILHSMISALYLHNSTPAAPANNSIVIISFSFMKHSLLLLFAPLLLAQEKVDLYPINRIKAEEFQNSKVMENAFYLSDVYGPRLTGSPGLKAAAEWAVRRMTEWGLANPNMEKWGPFGNGWTCVHFSASLKEPQFAPLNAFARPWTPGTNGPVSGEPVVAALRTDADLEKFKGKLKGKIVLLEDPGP